MTQTLELGWCCADVLPARIPQARITDAQLFDDYLAADTRAARVRIARQLADPDALARSICQHCSWTWAVHCDECGACPINECPSWCESEEDE